MHIIHDHESDADWGPLEELERRTIADTTPLVADMFMYMGRVILADDTTVHLYKNWETRRYINLDDEANAWRYVSSRKPDGQWHDGWYEPFPGTTTDAVIHAMVLDDGASKAGAKVIPFPPTHAPTMSEAAVAGPVVRSGAARPANRAPGSDGAA